MKLLFTTICFLIGSQCSGQIYTTHQGYIQFTSEAPLEVIEAKTNQMQGLVDVKKKIFAVKVYIKSFSGFNNPLQQVHFYENYMEASIYPIATFKGKILEPIVVGKDKYRAKGSLEIHGRSVERIIDVVLHFNGDSLDYSSVFIIPLADHDIKLPQIVYQKIAKEIRVQVSGKMIRK